MNIFIIPLVLSTCFDFSPNLSWFCLSRQIRDVVLQDDSIALKIKQKKNLCFGCQNFLQKLRPFANQLNQLKQLKVCLSLDDDSLALKALLENYTGLEGLDLYLINNNYEDVFGILEVCKKLESLVVRRISFEKEELFLLIESMRRVSFAKLTRIYFLAEVVSVDVACVFLHFLLNNQKKFPCLSQVYVSIDVDRSVFAYKKWQEILAKQKVSLICMQPREYRF